MRVWPVSTPDRSNRRSILKPHYPSTYYPTDDDEEHYSDFHWSQWPQNKSLSVNVRPPARPFTSTGYYRVPSPFIAVGGDIEDRPDSPEPGYAFGSAEVIEKSAPLTYVPELKSWVTNATNSYEREAAHKVSTTMYRSQTPMSQRSRSVSPTRTRPFFGRSLTMGEGGFGTYGYPDPTTHYSQSWNPYTGPLSQREDRLVSGMARHLEGSNPRANYTMYPQSRESRPLGRRTRRLSCSTDYVHDLSCFTSTQPMVTGHFIIHPDWVSERLSPMRRRAVSQTRLQY